jgi:hypothetical protein
MNKPKRPAQKISEQEVEEILSLPDALKKIPEHDLFCVRLRTEVYQRAKQKAKEEGTTPSDIIERAIKLFIPKK